jgi:RNA polymerase sigma-70 factor (ECF subfamily)
MAELYSNDNRSEMARGHSFLRLYQTNERRIYGFILALVPDWSEADDLMQETARVMWSKFDEFEPGTDFAAWAFCIARYQVMNHRKRKRTQKVQFSDQTVEAVAERVISATDNLDDIRDALKECLKKLSERDQQLIRSRYDLNASTRTVAEHIGRSIDAVYKSLNRIHSQLLRCIRRTLEMEGSL